ncbi:MAG: hypothetical protein ACJ77A_08855 [Actinomycetota bacterium]
MIRTVRRITTVLATAALLASVGTGAALAKTPVHHASSTSNFSLAAVPGSSSDTVPNWGDTVTFDISTSVTSMPSVRADCYQGADLVYRHFGFFYNEPSPSENFVLQSYVWTGGAAECTATLYYVNSKGEEVDLSTLPFHVDA